MTVVPDSATRPLTERRSSVAFTGRPAGPLLARRVNRSESKRTTEVALESSSSARRAATSAASCATLVSPDALATATSRNASSSRARSRRRFCA